MLNLIRCQINPLLNRVFILFLLLLACQSIVYGLTADEQKILETFTHEKDVVLKTVEGKKVNMDIFFPDPDKIQKKNPWMLFVHGGGWAGGSKYSIFKRSFLGTLQSLVDSGVVCATVEYRLARAPVTAYESVVDSKDAARFLLKNAEKYKLDVDRYGVWGGSAGGHLSLVTALGADSDFQGDPQLADFPTHFKCVASYFPLTSCINPDLRPGSIFENDSLFVRLLGGTVSEKPELARLLSPTELLEESSPPILLLHGENDTTLPIINSLYMMEVAEEKNANVQLLTIENAGHSFRGSNISPSIEGLNDYSANFILSHLKETNVSLHFKNSNVSQDRPNVILILTDDQGYGDFSVHGNPVLQTPVLDKLHDQSIRFTDFHVAPMCTPTRAQLLTGRDALDTGATAVCLGRSMPRENLPMMADIFKASGYRTVHYGKWHLGDSYPYRPQDRGFEETVTFGAFGIGSIADWYGNTYWSATFRHNDGLEKYKGYCTNVWFDLALDYIKKWKAGDDPFFMYLPTNCPHDPHLCDDQYSDPYLKKGMEPIVSKFFGQIANIDENMGRLLETLDRRSLAENTLLIYMSDNGTAKGHDVFNAGMRGSKKDPYDGGHRVPLFIRWRGGGLGKPRDIDTLTQCQDILPTLIDWCKLKGPENGEFDGCSLAPLFTGHSDALNDRILVVEYDNPYRPKENKAVLWKKWRLVKDSELYDISSDPGQTTDVADKHPDVVSHMRNYYKQWRQDAVKGYNQKRYIHLGSERQNPLMLYSSDWHGDYADNRNNLIAGNRIGSWEVSVEKPGMYEFTLSRWHPASGMALTAAVKDTSGRDAGALAVKQARLRIGDYDQTVSTETDQAEVKFKAELTKGVHNIETWFMDAKGNPLCSAYYTKAELVTGSDLGLSDRYEVQLLYSDDFNKSLDNWTTEIETEADIAIVDGKLDINTMVGSTVWFNQELSGPIMITYEVTTRDDGQDGLPRDHNLFWMALDPKAPNVRPSGAGSLGDYNCYDMYYAGIGGNKNRTTRFRRYHSCDRTLIQESTDKAHLNAANQTYRMKIVCIDNQIQVYRDGQIYWDFTDPSPYTEGWFGFRQTRTHLQIDNFKVYSLKEKASEDR